MSEKSNYHKKLSQIIMGIVEHMKEPPKIMSEEENETNFLL